MSAPRSPDGDDPAESPVDALEEQPTVTLETRSVPPVPLVAEPPTAPVEEHLGLQETLASPPPRWS